ncbi:hypothetical protein M5E86_05030 [Blautia wexlerae]|nr:hypothetical protein M5E86_05030 [Blautia wexlerae]
MGARSKRKQQAGSLMKIKQALESEVLSETGWSQIRIVKSGANPYQPGRAVKICWFYQ